MTAAIHEQATTESSSDGYLVRVGETRDLDAVYAIACAKFATADVYPQFLFGQFADILGEGFVVAEYRGEVVGYSVTMLDAAHPDHGVVLSSAVNPAHARSGVDELLHARAMRYLAERSREVDPKKPAPPREPYVGQTFGPYRVREFRASDLAGVYGVELSAFGDDPYPVLFFEQLATVLGGGFLVAESHSADGPAVVGYLLAVLDARYPDLGWVMSVAVHAEHRGHHVGYHLMDAAETYFKSQRCSEVMLTVDPDNVPAVTLYKNLDYREIERNDNHHGLNLSRLVMKQHTFVDVPRLKGE
ncbi:GNAT family N-acetyltransferase [Cryptosporangium aurantiacum]|uniref:Ribosomal protein S18 acetylase RimI n=1 Tax=Cryptosporangium aurantiacum TaxID=134849 RepID=A0A1M7RJQ7_9ACTN|nr:GNAT family N-acetyltransferase [Cryptosporangium aurantiacum]SHN46399.1 Ribosomal protein S18 acetylase RimI [Cryptosporangium aurantiacum]